MRRNPASFEPGAALPAADDHLTTATRPLRAAGESSRLGFLDGLRGIAALAVFFSHACDAVSPAYRAFVEPYLFLGNWGVVLFLFCSGFIIPVSLERQGSLATFWTRRAFRLYPLYWLSVVVVAAFGIGEALDLLHGPPVQFLWLIVANLTMFQGFLRVPHLMALYWTLTLELMFYIIISVLYLLKISTRTAPATVVLLLAMIVVELLVPQPFAFSYATHLLIILAGLVAYRVHSGEASVATGIAVAILLPLMLIAPLLVDPSDPYRQLAWVVAQVGACAYFGIAFLRRARMVRPALTYLGRISYSIYLLHPIVMAAIPRLSNPLLALLVWLVALILTASASYRWIEQPAIALGHRLTRAQGREARGEGR